MTVDLDAFASTFLSQDKSVLTGMNWPVQRFVPGEASQLHWGEFYMAFYDRQESGVFFPFLRAVISL